MTVRVLMLGDVVGRGARQAVCELVPQWRQAWALDAIIVNGENMAGGRGMNRKTLRNFWEAGVDVVTSGDHVWDQPPFRSEIKDLPQVLRPFNLPEEQPGCGAKLFTLANGLKIGVINLIGRVFMKMNADCPFRGADRALDRFKSETSLIYVDMHAEATSEKQAIGRWLDGRVTAVVGTHTHVQTADEQIFPGGTAFITDLGMVGSRQSIIGSDIEPLLTRFTTGMPASYGPVDSQIRLCGLLIEADETTGKAIKVERIAFDFGD